MTATYGDIIYVQRIGYRHFGVYVGNDKVIHYTKVSGSSCDGIIRETPIDVFLDGSQEYVVYKFEEEKLVNLVKTLSGGLSLMSPFSLMNAIRRLGKSFFSDLKIYSSASGGKVSYYRDRYGLEADCVLHLEDGRYALVEVKLGAGEIDNAAKHLLEIERLIMRHNETEHQCKIPLPSIKMVVTGTQYGYKRDDGVLVVPIGCLRD